MDSSSATITVKVDREEDGGSYVIYRAKASNDHGDWAGGTSTHSPALAIAEATGNLLDAFH